MPVDDLALAHEVNAVLEHRIVLGRKPGDYVRANRYFRALRSHPLDQIDGAFSGVPPFHPLQDHIVTCLQRQMDMRHQPWLAGDDIKQPFVNFDTVNRRQTQARQFGHKFQDTLDQLPEIGIAG